VAAEDDNLDTLDDDAADADDEGEEQTDDEIVREAHKRFLKCEKWEANARRRWLEDYKFAHGDDLNNYQWDSTLYLARTANERPALTINKTQQHNLQIINDAKQNKSGIKYRPVGDGATAESADVLEGIARHIQDISHAQNARGTAIEFQVISGMGFTRVVTDWEKENSFDQEIYIRPIDDPLSCYLDPDFTQADGSDSRYGFIFSDRPRDEVEREYPDLKGQIPPTNSVDGEDAGWLREDHVREAEYYRVKETRDELLGSSDGVVAFRSILNKKIIAKWEDEAAARGEKLQRREIIRKSLQWFKIVGNKIVARRGEPGGKKMPGKSVPIVPYFGIVTVIEGQLDRKGHTRAMRDSQRMLNYNRSAAIEFGALQSKTPYIAPARAIEGNLDYWETANRENHAFLPYNDIDDNGQPIAPPTRQEPPVAAPVFEAGAQAAERDMMIVSGQYEAEMGAPSNEVSGRAINERQRQGDRATYHFIDSQAIAIRREGQIILELIPEVYDTPRVKRIIADDGEESQVNLDPNAAAAHQVAPDRVTRVLNPQVGRYEVVSDVGPDYATQRQEAFEAITQIIVRAPQLLGTIGDLLFKVADFPMADKIAERLKPGLPPEAQEAIGKLQEQLQNSNKMLGEAMQALTEERLKVKAKDSDNTIKAYDADTKRLGVLKDMIPLDPADMQALIHETVRQALQDNLGPIVGSLAAQLRGDVAQGGTGELPIRVPDLGQQAAQPGGANPTPTMVQ
jgi:hypothetical protein